VRVISLASGSSGNALLVEEGDTRLLVDAGLGTRQLASRLRQLGVAPHSLRALLLTHEHHDHTCGAVPLAVLHSVPIMTDRRTLDETLKMAPALRVSGAPQHADLPVGRRSVVGTLEVRSFAVSHDAAAPCGFLITGGDWTVCVAIDTGEVTPQMAEALRAAHLLVVESNHDAGMLETGPYPYHLKRRIRGEKGHLSNTQTANALARALDGRARWVWLAHLSRTNNRPSLALTTVREYLRERGYDRATFATLPPDLGPTWESPASAEPDACQPTLWDATPAPRADAELPATADVGASEDMRAIARATRRAERA
jgi:phosphoribosyl 1,2-cyclic phosphodiesterase